MLDGRSAASRQDQLTTEGRRQFAVRNRLLWTRSHVPFLNSLIALFALCLVSVPAAAADLKPLVDALGKGGYEETVKHVGELAATGDPAAAPVLDALAAGDLYVRKADGAVVIAKKASDGFALTDPVTRADAGTVPSDGLDKIKINNKLRGVIRAALGSLTLMSPDAATRRAAAEAVFKSGDANAIELLDKSLAAEKDAAIARLMREARAVAILKADRPEAEKLAAVEALQARGDQDSLAILAVAIRLGDRGGQGRRRQGDRLDQQPPGALGSGAGRLVRPVARLGAAAWPPSASPSPSG